MTCEVYHQFFRTIAPYSLPIVSVYLVFIFQIHEYREQHLIQFPMERIRPWFQRWCFLLSLYSIIGFLSLTPTAYSLQQKRAWIKPPSDFDMDWRLNSKCCFWVMTFYLSKFVELGDTFFILLLNRPLLLLQWFHHMTTLLYVQDALTQKRFSSFWFIYMNLLVHSIMYSYYVKPYLPAWIITFSQILQMMAGLWIVWTDRQQGLDIYGFTMYALYFYLFSKYFINRYIYKIKKR